MLFCHPGRHLFVFEHMFRPCLLPQAPREAPPLIPPVKETQTPTNLKLLHSFQSSAPCSLVAFLSSPLLSSLPFSRVASIFHNITTFSHFHPMASSTSTAAILLSLIRAVYIRMFSVLCVCILILWSVIDLRDVILSKQPCKISAKLSCRDAWGNETKPRPSVSA